MKLSFEFFPPRSDAQLRRFWRTIGCLETLTPEFVSITWGALGTEQDASLTTLADLQDISTPVAAHLTCSGQSEDALRKTLSQLREHGIGHIVALRGDQPEDHQAKAGTMNHAIDLVKLINTYSAENNHDTEISVAAYPETHPEASSSTDDLVHLHAKLEAGAQRAITQFFFNADSFLSWRDEAVAVGISKPIVPGILPIHNLEKIMAFSEKCGATVPQTLINRFERYKDPASQHDVAVEHAYELCQTLSKEGIDDFHFYTLNQSDLSWHVCCLLKGKDKLIDLVAA